MDNESLNVTEEQPQVALQSDTEVVQQEVVATVDVDKTLYDAEEFLANFAGLRLENDQLKRSNEELQHQLEKARHDIHQMQLDKSNLEATLLKEREQHKEDLWKVRSEFQKVQEERLQWKEKYLNICMRNGTPSDLNLPGKKRKMLTAENENEEFYSNLASTFGLAGQDEQPEEIVLTLVSEQSKSYKISIRECPHCGVGFCSSFGLREHLKTCEHRKVATSPQQQRSEPRHQQQTSPDDIAISESTSNNCVASRLNTSGECHTCETCKVDFYSETELNQHNQYHLGTHKYLCRTCYRSYQSNPGRLKHEQLEHGSVPLLICDICGKQFKRKDRLKDHFATKHSLATPHECPYCEAAYKLRDYLRKHVNAMHPGKTLQHANAIIKDEAEMEIQMVVESCDEEIAKNEATSPTVIHTDVTIEAEEIISQVAVVAQPNEVIDAEEIIAHVAVAQQGQDAATENAN